MWNQSCQQLKSPKPQHFHEFFIQKNQLFSREVKVEFLDKKWRFRTVWAGVSDNEEATTHNALQWYFILKSVLFIQNLGWNAIHWLKDNTIWLMFMTWEHLQKITEIFFSDAETLQWRSIDHDRKTNRVYKRQDLCTREYHY